MCTSPRSAIVILSILCAAQPARAELIVSVPGTANPWLAGMPNGSTANAWQGTIDSAPGQSPIPIALAVGSGAVLLFSATGGTSNGPSHPLVGPDGGANFSNHATGAENGIAAARIPLSALVGVFLGKGPPGGAAPGGLDFSPGGNVPGGTSYKALSPALGQVFFIGDGRTADGTPQEVVTPPGASQLFLGTMDGFDWSNNPGSLQVTIDTAGVSDLPEPGALALAMVGGMILAACARRRMAGSGISRGARNLK
jgi:hypothetical protein